MMDIKIKYEDLSEQKQLQVKHLLRGEAVVEWCVNNKKDIGDFYEPNLTEKEVNEINELVTKKLLEIDDSFNNRFYF